MEQAPEDRLAALYPTPLIRGRRITRMEERDIGPFQLTAETARELGQDGVGVFIGACGTIDRVIELVRRIDTCEVGGHWVAVPATRWAAALVHRRWRDPFDDSYLDAKKAASAWTANKVTFCLPESLSHLLLTIKAKGIAVAGVLLLDLDCVIHKARGFRNGDFRVRHDRPQLIVDFRAGLSEYRWTPPLICLSGKPAKSVPTDSMRRTYCLEAFLFIDGRTVRCGPLPNQSATVLLTRAYAQPHSIVCAC